MNVTFSCLQCGSEFDLIPEEGIKNESMLFCSKECREEYEDVEHSATCIICGKEFFVPDERKEKSTNFCCSSACSSILKDNIYAKTGVLFSKNNYLLIPDQTHPFRTKDGFVYAHRIIMEEYLRHNYPDSQFLIKVEGFDKEFIDPNVQVLHKGENRLDNRVENLECFILSDHATIINTCGDYIRDEVSGNFILRAGRKKKTDTSFGNLKKKDSSDAALDITSSEDVEIPPRSSKIISTDLFIAIPQNHVGLIWSRSGLSVKHNLEVGAGCIDSGYRGEIKVHLYNHGEKEYNVTKGDRIAQLLTIPINTYTYLEADVLDSTDRGDSGFGASGMQTFTS